MMHGAILILQMPQYSRPNFEKFNLRNYYFFSS